MFWRKVLDIYATSIDYDPRVEASQQFFKTVQNKMHWAAHDPTELAFVNLTSQISIAVSVIGRHASSITTRRAG